MGLAVSNVELGLALMKPVVPTSGPANELITVAKIKSLMALKVTGAVEVVGSTASPSPCRT